MESPRFDQLTKVLAGSTSRRRALKTIAVATGGGVLGLSATGTAHASSSACAVFCAAVFGTDIPAAAQCISDAAHQTGLCYSCGPASPGGGVTPCAICCTRTTSGFCASYSGAACCPSGQACQNGTCAEICPSGQSVQCVPVCSANQLLQVQCVSCPPGETVCAGACTNTASDPNNCGTCGTVCPSGTVCSAGTCVACPSGQVACGNTCTDLSSDPSNCGACGNVCTCGPPQGGDCVGGACPPACQSGTCVCGEVTGCTSGSTGICVAS
jgi:hypothetical protein